MAAEGNPKGLSSKLEKKRKRQADESTKQSKPDTAPTAAPAVDGPNKKKRKKAKKNKQSGQDAETQDRKDGIDESIGKMDGRLLGDYFAQRAKKLDKELSAVELSDLSVPGMSASICEWCFVREGFADQSQILLSSIHRRLPSHGRWRRFLISSRRSVLGVLICQNLRKRRVHLTRW